MKRLTTLTLILLIAPSFSFAAGWWGITFNNYSDAKVLFHGEIDAQPQQYIPDAPGNYVATQKTAILKGIDGPVYNNSHLFTLPNAAEFGLLPQTYGGNNYTFVYRATLIGKNGKKTPFVIDPKTFATITSTNLDPFSYRADFSINIRGNKRIGYTLAPQMRSIPFEGLGHTHQYKRSYLPGSAGKTLAKKAATHSNAKKTALSRKK